jgi:hypothetical protein
VLKYSLHRNVNNSSHCNVNDSFNNGDCNSYIEIIDKICARDGIYYNTYTIISIIDTIFTHIIPIL